jgi:hypothetical protein
MPISGYFPEHEGVMPRFGGHFSKSILFGTSVFQSYGGNEIAEEKMQATQLPLDFTFRPLLQEKPSPITTSWHDVTDLARGIGFRCACEISQELYEHLSDQSLYDALWTAWLTLSLDKTDLALFTLDADVGGKPIRFKAITTHHAVQLGRVEAF